MLQSISIKEWGLKEKKILLRELGFTTDSTFIFTGDGKKVIDKYIDIPVEINNMLILPGSTIIIDNNPLSIASFLEEYPNAL